MSIVQLSVRRTLLDLNDISMPVRSELHYHHKTTTLLPMKHDRNTSTIAHSLPLYTSSEVILHLLQLFQ